MLLGDRKGTECCIAGKAGAPCVGHLIVSLRVMVPFVRHETRKRLCNALYVPLRMSDSFLHIAVI